MVWVFDSPLTEKERKAYDVLKKRFGNEDLARDTVKIISLYRILTSSKFESPKQIEEEFYYDKSHNKPIFNKKTSEELFKHLKKHGGAASNYPFVDYSVRQGLKKIESFLPEYIVNPIQNVYGLLTSPLLTLKEQVPIADLAISAANGVAETGITAIGDIAKTVGGPMGTAISIPIVAFAAAVATTTSMIQQDFGQSVIYMVTAIPIVGSILVKGLDKIEKQVSKIKKYPDIAYYVPFVNGYINEDRAKKGLPPLEPFDPEKAIQNKIQSNPYAQKAMTVANRVGGKRFSTQRSRYKQWKKTRRNKSARV